MSYFKKGVSLLFLVLSMFFVAGAVNAAPVQQTPLFVVNNFEKLHDKSADFWVQGVYNNTLLPEDQSSSYDMNAGNVPYKKMITLVKTLRTQILKPAKTLKPTKIDGQNFFILSGSITQTGAYNAVQLFGNFVDRDLLVPREYNALKFAKGAISKAKMELYFDANNYQLKKVNLSWRTYDARFKNSIEHNLAMFVSYNYPFSYDKEGKIVPVAGADKGGIMKNEFVELPQKTPTIKVVDSNGNGGVVSVSSGDSSSVAGRDSQRLNDLRSLQTALELFFVDQGFYPSASALTLGQGQAACLNSDGFNSRGDCPYPYMAKVPSDPSSGLYTYTGGGSSYTVTTKLEGVAGGLTGTIKLLPTGISQ